MKLHLLKMVRNTGKYEYNGKKTLKYPKGNRGVRFMFKLVDGNDKDLPKFIQFSDHNIAPKGRTLPYLYG